MRNGRLEEKQVKDCFKTLQIERTKDAAEIKMAYYGLLKQVNPEENPEGFKRLRAAYEMALTYAVTPEETEEIEGIVLDNSPVGIFLAKFEEIYASISRRIDSGEWERLLAEPVLWSLEDGEKAKWGLFERLLDKFHLPVKIWEVLDHTFFIEINRKEFEEHLPVGFVEYILSKIGDKKGDWDCWYEQLKGADGADFDGFIEGYAEYRNQLRERKLEDLEERRRCLEDLDAYGIEYPFLELEWAEYRLCERWARCASNAGTKQKLIDQFRKLAEKYSEKEEILVRCADGLYKLGLLEEAETLYEACLERDGLMRTCRFLALYGKAKICADRKNWKEAGRLAKEVHTIGTTEDFSRFYENVLRKAIRVYEMDADHLTEEDVKELGESYIHTEQAESGWAFFEAHPEYCFDYAWWHAMVAQIHFMREKYQESISEIGKWRECLKREKEQVDDGEPEDGERKSRREELAGTYAMEGAAWRQVYEAGQKESEGDEPPVAYVMAESNLKRAIELDPKVMAFYMNLAALYQIAKNYQGMLDICEEALKLDENYYWTHFYLQEAYEGLGMAQKVVDAFYRIKSIYGGAPEIYERAARVFISYRQYDDANGILRQAKETGVESFQLMLQSLKVEERLAKTKEEWKSAMDHARQVVQRMRRGKVSKELLAEALMVGYFLNENEPMSGGKTSRIALKYVLQSQELVDDVAKLYYIGRLYREYFKDDKKAEHYLKLCEERGMDFEWVYIYLGEIKADAGKRDEAIAYYQKALEYNPNSKEVYWRIGWVYLRRFDYMKQTEDGKKALEYFLLQDEKCGIEIFNYWRKAKVRYFLKDFEAALEDAEKSLSERESAGKWKMKADVLAGLRRFEEAAESYLNSIHCQGRHNEDDSYCLEKILMCYGKMGDYEGAVACLKKLLGEFEEAKKEKEWKKCCEYLSDAEGELGNLEQALYWLGEEYGSYDVTRRHCESLSDEADRIHDIYNVWWHFLPAREGKAEAEKYLAQTAAWIEAELAGDAVQEDAVRGTGVREDVARGIGVREKGTEDAKETVQDRAKLWKTLADIYYYLAEFGTAAGYYEKVYALTKRRKNFDGAEDLAESMMLTYFYLGDQRRAAKFAEICRRNQDEDYKEYTEKGFAVDELLDGQTTAARNTLYKYFMCAFCSGKLQEAKAYVEKMKQGCICYWCSEEECTEMQTAMALLAWQEGDYKRARALCELANRSCYRGNNVTAQQLLLWMERK